MSKLTFSKVEIIQDENQSTGKILIDGVEIKGAQEVKLNWKAGNIPVVTVSFLTDALSSSLDCLLIGK
ncbi:MAG: hypothetical protein LBS36_01850 [Oscillospiraceae bacterium]|jgi:hypothetical protein|nr:hypothetical protein [Oscillospiraceae bacterium]